MSSSSDVRHGKESKPFGKSVMICLTGINPSHHQRMMNLPFFLNDMQGGDEISYSSSGFVISNRKTREYYIITSGTLLAPFISSSSESVDIHNITHQVPNLKCKITVTLPNGVRLFNEILPANVKRFGKSVRTNSDQTFIHTDIQFCGTFSYSVTDKYLYQMMSQLQGWYWGHPMIRKSNQNIESHTNSYFAEPFSKFDDSSYLELNVNNSEGQTITPSTFSIFKVNNENDFLDDLVVSLPKPSTLLGSIAQGDEIFIVSSPFGLLSPHTLSNHLSKGVISNTINNASNMTNLAILTDSQVHPGSEGGPVFTKINSQTKCIGVSRQLLYSKFVVRFVHFQSDPMFPIVVSISSFLWSLFCM